MGYTKTTWTDRNVQYPARYLDELNNVKTFTPSPGTVTDAGTKATAARMNNIESGLESAHKGTHIYGASSNGTDSYTLTFSPAFTAYNAGMTINFKADVGNTGVATINIDGLGVKAIKKIISSGKTDVATGDIISNVIYTVIFDGTDFILSDPNSINNSILTTQGDILYASSAYTPTRLGKGLYLQGLRMNSAETAPEWGNVMIAGFQLITSTATFTAPKTGVYKVSVVGGGGSAGRPGTGSNPYGGSGGTGGYAIKWVTLNKSDAVTVTIGTGGAVPASANSSGIVGGTSSFGAYCSATGGSGGAVASGAYVAAASSGSGSGGDLNITPQKGVPLWQPSSGFELGYAGNSLFGTTYGCGGQGTNGFSTIGNAGGNGVCLIEW